MPSLPIFGPRNARMLGEDAYVGGLRALLSGGLLVLDLLPFVQRLIPFALDSAEVHEQILASILRGDESIPLLRIEPLNRSDSHLIPTFDLSYQPTLQPADAGPV